MIVCSDETPVIGKIYQNMDLTDRNGEWRKATFKVMREATLEEYLEWCRECDCLPVHITSNFKFYLISID